MTPNEMDVLSKAFKHLSRSSHEIWKEVKDDSGIISAPQLRSLALKLKAHNDELITAAKSVAQTSQVSGNNIELHTVALEKANDLFVQHYDSK